MGLQSPGPRRAAAAVASLLLALSLAPVVASAQASIGSESDLAEAEDARDTADRLVLAAVADRDAIEIDLLATLERYQQLSAELAELGASVDRLRERIAVADVEVSTARDSASDLAVAAYMEALSMSGGLMLATRSLEQAMVAARTLQLLAGEGEEQATSLAVVERDLRGLNERLQSDMATLQGLRVGVEKEAARLQELFAQADQTVSIAIADALAADLAYRQALDQVEQARAAEEERKRQEERQTTTSTLPVSSTTTAITSPTTSTTSLPRPLKPAVEQWRGLVARFFSADLVDPALRVMQCESLGDPQAYNPYSGASGLYQFLPATWAVTSARAGYDGYSAFDPEANVAAAAWLSAYYQSRGQSPWVPWHCKP